MLWTEKVTKILQKYWGYSELKKKQIDVINELLLGNDVIGLLPTGYGKSMCYLIPPLVSNKTMIIISPLISLMDDQKDKLLKLGIPVSALHGNNKHKDSEIFEIIDGKIKIIYMSPEYLIKCDGLELVKTLVENNLLGFLAIDEAHCISLWGHDFRSEYLQIKEFRKLYPNIPILAVTATATNIVVNEIAKNLNLNNAKIIKANFDRPNLFLKNVEYVKDKVDKKVKKPKMKDITDVKKDIDMNLLIPYIEKYKNDKIIIYTNSRQACVNVSNEINILNSNKFISEAYHAGMSKNIRETVQNNFTDGTTQIIVSTIAFGMGIDQIVRCVIIIGAPSSIESYWQQIGRAGRDNLPAETVLFFRYQSLIISKKMLEKENLKPAIKQNKKKNLDIMGEYFFLKTCRRRFVLEHFNQQPTFFCCDNCDNCCNPNLQDITKFILDIKLLPLNIKQYLIAYKLIKELYGKLMLHTSLNNWLIYIKSKNYTLTTLPENLKIKIVFDQKLDDFDKYDLLLKNIK
jgi:RecQ family ATP-dependent DNA helicase